MRREFLVNETTVESPGASHGMYVVCGWSLLFVIPGPKAYDSLVTGQPPPLFQKMNPHQCPFVHKEGQEICESKNNRRPLNP